MAAAAAATATAACFPSNPTFSICSHSRRSKPSRLSGIYSLRSLVTPPSLSTCSSRCPSSRSAEELKRLPPASVAVKYNMGDDLYLFDEFQTARASNTRRPIIENLYDVFVNVRDDEGEHCKTMKACQTHGSLRSPHLAASEEDDVGCVLPQADCEGIVDCIKKFCH